MIKSLKNFKNNCCDVSLYDHNRNPQYLSYILSPVRFAYIFLREFFLLFFNLLNKSKYIEDNYPVILFAGTKNQLAFAKEYQKYFRTSAIVCFAGANNNKLKNINFFPSLFFMNRWLFQWLYWGVFKKNKLRKAIFCNPEKFAIAQSDINLNKYLGCKLAVVFSSYSVQSKKIIDYFNSKNIDTLFIPHALIPKKNPVIDAKYTFLTSHQTNLNNCLRKTKIINSNVNPFLNINFEDNANKNSILMCVNKCDHLFILFKYFLILYKSSVELGFILRVRFHPAMMVRHIFRFMNWISPSLIFSQISLIEDLKFSFVVVSGLSNVILDAKNNHKSVLVMLTFDEELRMLHEPSFFDGCDDLSLNYIEAKNKIREIFDTSDSSNCHQARTSQPVDFIKFIENYV